MLTVEARVAPDNTDLIVNLLEEAIGRAVRETLTDVKVIAVGLVPVDTGALQSTIRVEMDADGMGGSVIAGGENDVNYAYYVEMGHYSTGGNWVPPQPYMRPAADYAATLLAAHLAEL